MKQSIKIINKSTLRLIDDFTDTEGNNQSIVFDKFVNNLLIK